MKIIKFEKFVEKKVKLEKFSMASENFSGIGGEESEKGGEMHDCLKGGWTPLLQTHTHCDTHTRAHTYTRVMWHHLACCLQLSRCW